MKEPTIPVAVLRQVGGLLHIISPVPKAYRATQARSCRASKAAACLVGDESAEAFEGFSFGLQIGLSIVVGGVEADMPEPASDHRDVDSRCDR